MPEPRLADLLRHRLFGWEYLGAGLYVQQEPGGGLALGQQRSPVAGIAHCLTVHPDAFAPLAVWLEQADEDRERTSRPEGVTL
jgi:hypothetical protein